MSTDFPVGFDRCMKEGMPDGKAGTIQINTKGLDELKRIVLERPGAEGYDDKESSALLS
jgi:hypothetical protein